MLHNSGVRLQLRQSTYLEVLRALHHVPAHSVSRVCCAISSCWHSRGAPVGDDLALVVPHEACPHKASAAGSATDERALCILT